MPTSAFKSIEDRLRIFLHDLCVKLSNGNDDCVYDAFDGRFTTFSQLETHQYCRLLTKNISRSKGPGNCVLFERHLIPQHAVDDLYFVTTLRNKYSHQNGRETFHSNEQLADILIIQRLVRELSINGELQNDAKELLASLDNLIKELVAQVAQVEMPEQFDTDGETNVLSQSDREFIKEAVSDVMRQAQFSAVPVATSAEDSTYVAAVEFNALSASIDDRLEKLVQKLAPLSSLKGRLDSLESSISAQLADLDIAVSGIGNRLPNAETVNDREEEDLDSIEDVDDNDLYEEDADSAESFSSNAEILDRLQQMAIRLDKLPVPLSPSQARDELITLRKRIWRETQSGPSGDGLLRKSMIDYFLYYLPATPKKARSGRMKYWLTTVADDQLPYLDDVCAILRRVVN
jgi:hypothetical protein